MKGRTFEDMVKTPEIPDGTAVDARIGTLTFSGKVVGKSGSSGLLTWYIIECMDGVLPNEIYNYKFVSLPLSEIFVK